MGLFDFLHRPSGKNTQEVIKEVEKIPTMMSIYREDGTQTEVLNVEEAQKFRHSDGSISSLISARVIHVNQGDTIYLDAADPICFEIPEGRYDLAKELITRFTGMYTGIELNEKSYTYLGRAYSEEDIRLQPPTAVVNEQIGKLNEKLLEEITNKIINKIKKQNKLEKLIILEFYPIKKYGTLIILKNIKTILKTENEIEVKIIINTDYPILYKIDYNIIKECNIDYKNIYYYKNNFYLQIKNTISEKDYLYLLELSELTYQNTLNIINYGLKIKL